MKQFKLLLILCSIFIVPKVFSQDVAKDRFKAIESKLDSLSKKVKGLNQPVDFSVTGITIQDFLRGLAESNELNISIDTKLTARVYNNFNDEKAKVIILFLCKEYNLDIRFVGSIMSFYQFKAPVVELPKVAPKKIDLSYNSSKDQLSLSLRNDTLQKVLKTITQLSGKNVITNPEVDKNLLLNAYIQNMPFKNAVEKMAFTNNLLLEITPDSFYVLTTKPKEVIEEEEVTTNRSSRSRKKNSSKSRSSNSSDGKFDLEVIDSLGTQYVTFSGDEVKVSDVVREVSNESGINYYLFSEPKGSVNLTVNDLPYDEFMKFLLTGSDFTYRVENDIYLIGERKAEGLRETKVIQLEYRSYVDIQEAIPTELKKGVEIKEFPELNSFVLSGSVPQIAEIEKITKELDQVVPLIMIEVILVDIRKGRSLNTGISAGLADTTSGGSILPGLSLVLSSAGLNRILSPLNLGRVTNNFYVGLSALDNQDYADVKSMPKLATLNSHQANMTIGETRYYLTQTQNISGSISANNTVTDQWNPITAQLSVDITPVVSGDEHVTLEIDVTVSDFIGGTGGNAPPASTERSFNSLIRVKDNEMILLGGMETTNKSESGSGFPILSRIPIIKWIFSSRSKSKSKSVSFVFIKPTIVY